ncbi:hydroquinone glucosyltransferase-like [Camellia sinensis]|uniref:Glycosyltransferase n=1 Tax=Camellia sinensis var. sinensis TaxID=542762 RepID=A0A4S4D741_CAMSN|nr:hydroquinone glucosyltransferase-like [Camellia sinensis]XP_028117632.1 hydroquinone glucosyltransferase-like [Camellia sinensis]XP_028117633.1 hydroquinone glucosyltransferase-like [Camellia sinensis]THF97763.1 hypothetical protein TEA_025980 [Camellia sinensis var. sinensis]
MEQTPHIAILPSPGLGHLIPLAEFAKQLVHRHSFSATFIIPTAAPPSSAQTAALESLPKSINYLFLPPITFHDHFEGPEAVTQIALTVIRSLPSFSEVLESLIATTKLVALVVDYLSTEAIHVAKQFCISSYLFSPSPAMALSWCFFFPKLHDQLVSDNYRDLPELVQIPGCVPVHGRDLVVDLVRDRDTVAYKWILHHCRQFSLADGIILNSFMDLEPGPIKALQGDEPGIPPVYPIGPIVRAGSSNPLERSECLQWLDIQPRGSVLFVSFGSGGTLSNDQLNELALGLEVSGHRFLWVVKGPNDSANATYFSVQSQDDPFGFLPNGFMERTKERALLVPSWAPQVEILSHGSTGGFVTHCGWNSVLESVVNGIPLIAWPLFAEQKMNAVMLSEGLKVALRPNMNQNGILGRDEIAEAVKALMEGDEGKMLRNHMLELKEAALKVLSNDGSSTKLLSELAHKWKSVGSILDDQQC